jgi:hypothetical protein
MYSIAFSLFLCDDQVSMVEKDSSKENKWKKHVTVYKGGSGALYGFGFIGAAVYYIQHATSFFDWNSRNY